MSFNSSDISSISQNLEEFIIRKEVKTRELLSFLFKIGIKVFLDFIKANVVSEKFCQIFPTMTVKVDVRFVVNILHEFIPLTTDQFELLRISHAVSPYVW
jgi:predicted signal transduction protein with EAL and GGDEF domain